MIDILDPISQKHYFLWKPACNRDKHMSPQLGSLTPTMALKVVNYNKLLSPIVSSHSIPVCVAQRSLSFMLVSPIARFYMPNWRKFNIDFWNKVNENIQNQIPLSKQKGLRGVSDSTKRRHHFKIPISPMSPAVSEGHKNNIKVIKR